MTSYGEVYLTCLGLDETDFIGCNICQKKATEFHHIISRGKFKEGLNMIENISPTCRTCHIEYGDKTDYMVMLLKIHRRRLQLSNIKFNNKFFEFYIKKYEAKQKL